MSFPRAARLLRLLPILLAAVLAPALAASPAFAMSFRVVTLDGGCSRACPSVVVAEGEIGEDTDKEFVAFITRIPNQRVKRVMLIHSPGGSLIGSLKFGIALRATRFATIVGRVEEERGRSYAISGSCMSGCVYAIMGGVKRVVTPSGRLGIHRATVAGSTGTSAFNFLLQQRRMPEDIGVLLRSYTRFMGVNPRLIDWAERIGPGSIRILTTREITQMRLASIGR